MIEVETSAGDYTCVETAEEALLAAKTMLDDAYRASGGASHHTVKFSVDGEVVAANVHESLLWTVRL